jgi:hypothetical protein
MVPPLAVELLERNQITSSKCSKTSKAESGSSSDEVHSGACSPPAVAVKLQATVELPASPLVAKDLLAVIDVEDSPSVEVLTPELQLDIAFEVLHRLDMARRSRSLSMEELDLVEFLDTQVAMLSSSLAYGASIVESPMPTPMACQVVDLQSDLLMVMDAPVAVAPDVIVGS